MNISLLMSGDEIMTGDIIDSNSALIAKKLMDLGVIVHEKITVGDQIDLIVEKLQQLSKVDQLVIVNGGLGPTADDLTSEAAAKAGGEELKINPGAEQHLMQFYKKRDLRVTQENLKQAFLPVTANLIPNELGTAVGFKMKINKAVFYFTPGVPSELNHMLEKEIVPEIKDLIDSNERYLVKRFHLFGIGESDIQKRLNEKLNLKVSKNLRLGFRVYFPYLELKIFYRSNLESEANDLELKIGELFDNYILDSENGAEQTYKFLKDKQAMITFAESCTGGLISSEFTKISGVSSVFSGGFVTYSNEVKSKMLGVEENILEKYGAVSAPVVESMAMNARKKVDSDYAISVSGVAGPSGGSEEKPVGTVFIGLSSRENTISRKFLFKGTRQKIQKLTAATAFDLFLRFAEGGDLELEYSFDHNKQGLKS